MSPSRYSLRLIFCALPGLILTACLKKTPAIPQDSDNMPDPSITRALADTALEIQTLWAALGRIEQSRDPGSIANLKEYPGGEVPEDLRQELTLETWTGDIGVLARQLAGKIGYHYTELGHKPAQPLIVTIIATVATSGNNPAAFLRVDGANSMLADLNVGGNNIDNASTVNATTLSANTFTDANHPGFSVDPGGTSTMNQVSANIVYDRDNTAYYVDPASTSKLHTTSTDNLRVATKTEGTACSSGSIALDNQGKLLTCQGSIWKKGASGSSGGYVSHYQAGNIYTFPSGTMLPGHHHLCSASKDGNKHDAGIWVNIVPGTEDSEGRYRWRVYRDSFDIAVVACYSAGEKSTPQPQSCPVGQSAVATGGIINGHPGHRCRYTRVGSYGFSGFRFR